MEINCRSYGRTFHEVSLFADNIDIIFEFRDTDKNKDGMLDSDEYYRSYNNLLEMGLVTLSANEYDQIRGYSFEDIDSDNDGYISKAESVVIHERLIDQCEHYKKTTSA